MNPSKAPEGGGRPVYDPEYGWAPAWTNGEPRPFILVHHVSASRREACEAMGAAWRREDETAMQGWRRAYRKGARCIRVKVEAAFGYGQALSKSRASGAEVDHG